MLIISTNLVSKICQNCNWKATIQAICFLFVLKKFLLRYIILSVYAQFYRCQVSDWERLSSFSSEALAVNNFPLPFQFYGCNVFLQIFFTGCFWILPFEIIFLWCSSMLVGLVLLASTLLGLLNVCIHCFIKDYFYM